MDLVTLDADNQAQAVNILTRAFHDDPILNWVSSDSRFLHKFFEFTLPLILQRGLSYMDKNGYGAAAWLGPADPLPWPLTPFNVWKVFRLGGAGGFYRFIISGMKSAKCHPREPHYYLFSIGAVPERQGQGIGTSLMAAMLRKCDEEQMPAYLENSKEGNLPFYEGHGFRVLEQIAFSRKAPPLWLMWRDPKPAA